MTLRGRLFLLVTLIIVMGVSSTAGVFAYISWQSMLDRTKANATVLAQLLSQAVSVIQQLPLTVEELVGDGTAVGAEVIARLTQVARERGATAVQINRTLQEIAVRQGIPEIWVTDSHGTPVYWSLYDIDASIGVDSGFTQQSVFRPLLEGQRSSVFTSLNRTLDGRQLYYGGAVMPDKSGMVLVGRSISDLKDFDHRVGLQRMLETVMAGALIDAIWIFDSTLKPLADAAVSGADKAAGPTGTGRGLLETVIKSGMPDSYREGDWVHDALFGRALLYVAAPIVGPDGLISGAALMRLSIDMQQDTRALAMIGGGLSALLLLLGMALALPFLNHTVRPLARLTVQTRRLVERNFQADPEMFAQLAQVTENRHDEVAYLGGAVHSMVKTLETYIAELQETTAAKERIEGELAAARSIQMGILPRSFELPACTRCELYALLEPAKAVGGDLFDFFLLDEQRLFFLIGDVSDKGVPAALFMAVTKTLFNSEAQRDSSSVGGIMERVNRALCKDNPEGMFVTVLAGILDLRRGEIIYSDGGHEPPVVLRGAGVEMIEKRRGGLVLGFMADSVYQEEIIRLAPGDGLVIYTDGVTEAMNVRHELFKAARLHDTLASLWSHEPPARPLIEGVLSAVRGFAGGYPQSDDITLLALRWHGPAD